MAETLLALRDVRVDYGGSAVLRIPCLDVHAGEVLAIIGPNGSGKSTLLRLLGLLQRPNAGRVYFRNKEALPKNSLNLRRRIASVFQEPLLLNGTVYDNASLGLRLRGLSREEINRRLDPWLRRLGIDRLSSRSVRTLSGGEAQRTCLARAFVLAPDVLLLDEPFSPLDPLGRESLLYDLRVILKETRITTVLVTHDRDEAFSLADRVGVLCGGELAQLGATEDVFARPATAAAAEVVGVENRIPGVVESVAGEIAMVLIGGGAIETAAVAAPGTCVTVCVRAEAVRVGCIGESSGPSNRANQLRAEVVEVFPGTARSRIALRWRGIGLVARLDRKASFPVLPRKGEEVTVYLDPKDIHVIGSSGSSGARRETGKPS